MDDEAHHETRDECPVPLAAVARCGPARNHERSHIRWQTPVFGTSQRKHVTWLVQRPGGAS